MREKLYIAYTELLRADFNSAEDFLKEYETLCEIPANAGETPEEQSRREDDTKRRKRQYRYSAGARRESQGRLRGSVRPLPGRSPNLGEGKQLLEMPDEPNVKMRPDVWSARRIEAMIRRRHRRSEEVARRPRPQGMAHGQETPTTCRSCASSLPSLVRSSTTAVRAQFKLAEVLLSTKNEADSRERKRTCRNFAWLPKTRLFASARPRRWRS